MSYNSLTTYKHKRYLVPTPFLAPWERFWRVWWLNFESWWRWSLNKLGRGESSILQNSLRYQIMMVRLHMRTRYSLRTNKVSSCNNY